MAIQQEFILVNEGKEFSNDELDIQVILDRRLFKAFSLFVAKCAEINVPPTLLLLDASFECVQNVISRWGLPLMMRVDYASLNLPKPLGGIPLGSLDTIKSVSKVLFSQAFYPLLHPDINRFDDVYSVGILMIPDSYEVTIEVVGRGFDASDLRLGTTTPHESISYDVAGDRILRRDVILADAYRISLVERARRVSQFRHYIKFANREGRLLSSLEEFYPSEEEISNACELIPTRYVPLNRQCIRELAGIAFKLRENVLPRLPASGSFVASFSLTRDFGWILWDIYGRWYKR